MTDRYAVIGNPVAHSLSPRIHAAFAAATSEDIEYGKLEAPADGFADAASEFFAGGGRGLNVTVPFKLDAWRWVGGHDEAAAASGAVNTIVPVADGTADPAQGVAWRGCNTDGVGLVNDLANNLGWPLAGARALVLGAGGAVQGVLAPLVAAGVADLTIANRTLAKAEALAAKFGVAACGLDAVATGWDLVVNGTSAGLAGTGDLIDPGAVAGSRCYDMFYSPDGSTAFTRWALRCDALAASDGLGMLVEQAAEAFFLWRGARPDTQGVAASLRAPQQRP